MSSRNYQPISAKQMVVLPRAFRALLQLVIDHYERYIAQLEGIEVAFALPSDTAIDTLESRPCLFW